MNKEGKKEKKKCQQRMNGLTTCMLESSTVHLRRDKDKISKTGRGIGGGHEHM